MTTRIPVPLIIFILVLSSSCAADVDESSSSDRQYFDIRTDKWMSLHHFAFHAARFLSEDALQGRVALSPEDQAVLSGGAATAFVPLAEAYAPYTHQSILFSPETRAIAKALTQGPDRISDEKLKRALEEFMPVYEARFWPRHRQWAIELSNSLSKQLERHGPQMVSRLTSYLEQDWPDQAIRVDLVPYANWAGAYTDDAPAHITLATNDPDISMFAFEILFHEASHTKPLGLSIDLAAEQALQEAGLTSNRFWHYLLFYLTGQAASEVLGDPDYVPYAHATGKASLPTAAPFYRALELTWNPDNSLVERATAAAIEVAASQATPRQNPDQ
jgi:hypothetical protein